MGAMPAVILVIGEGQVHFFKSGMVEESGINLQAIDRPVATCPGWDGDQHAEGRWPLSARLHTNKACGYLQGLSGVDYAFGGEYCRVKMKLCSIKRLCSYHPDHADKCLHDNVFPKFPRLPRPCHSNKITSSVFIDNHDEWPCMDLTGGKKHIIELCFTTSGDGMMLPPCSVWKKQGGGHSNFKSIHVIAFRHFFAVFEMDAKCCFSPLAWFDVTPSHRRLVWHNK